MALWPGGGVGVGLKAYRAAVAALDGQDDHRSGRYGGRVAAGKDAGEDFVSAQLGGPGRAAKTELPAQVQGGSGGRVRMRPTSGRGCQWPALKTYTPGRSGRGFGSASALACAAWGDNPDPDTFAGRVPDGSEGRTLTPFASSECAETGRTDAVGNVVPEDAPDTAPSDAPTVTPDAAPDTVKRVAPDDVSGAVADLSAVASAKADAATENAAPRPAPDAAESVAPKAARMPDQVPFHMPHQPTFQMPHRRLLQRPHRDHQNGRTNCRWTCRSERRTRCVITGVPAAAVKAPRKDG